MAHGRTVGNGRAALSADARLSLQAFFLFFPITAEITKVKTVF